MSILSQASEFWKKFNKYIYAGIGVLILLFGLVWVGRWYADGKAEEFAARLHERWMATDGRALYDNIAINREKLDELNEKYRNQSAEFDRFKRQGRGTVDNAIKTGNPKVISGMFDNLVDRYTPSK